MGTATSGSRDRSTSRSGSLVARQGRGPSSSFERIPIHPAFMTSGLLRKACSGWDGARRGGGVRIDEERVRVGVALPPPPPHPGVRPAPPFLPGGGTAGKLRVGAFAAEM